MTSLVKGEVPATTAPPGQPTVGPGRRFAIRGKRARTYATFLALVGPNVVLIAAFIYFPLASNIYYSTLDWRLGAPNARPVGLANYLELFTSPQGLGMWRVTIIFTVVTVAASMVLGLLMALGLDRKRPGRTRARTALFSPYVLSGVGVGLVWMFIFDPRIGLLGHVLRQFGAASPDWFIDPTLALVMVIIVYVWKNLGYCAVVYLAGLQAIPRDLIEAAQIDGANAPRRFWHIKLPLLGPTVFFLLITSILSSMQAFDILRIMTPTGNGTNTIIFEIFLQSFGAYQRAGYSAAIAVVLFVVLFAVTSLQIRFIEKKVHYA